MLDVAEGRVLQARRVGGGLELQIRVDRELSAAFGRCVGHVGVDEIHALAVMATRRGVPRATTRSRREIWSLKTAATRDVSSTNWNVLRGALRQRGHERLVEVVAESERCHRGVLALRVIGEREHGRRVVRDAVADEHDTVDAIRRRRRAHRREPRCRIAVGHEIEEHRAGGSRLLDGLTFHRSGGVEHEAEVERRSLLPGEGQAMESHAHDDVLLLVGAHEAGRGGSRDLEARPLDLQRCGRGLHASKRGLAYGRWPGGLRAGHAEQRGEEQRDCTGTRKTHRRQYRGHARPAFRRVMRVRNSRDDSARQSGRPTGATDLWAALTNRDRATRMDARASFSRGIVLCLTPARRRSRRPLERSRTRGSS